jgi:hypothetical protein
MLSFLLETVTKTSLFGARVKRFTRRRGDDVRAIDEKSCDMVDEREGMNLRCGCEIARTMAFVRTDDLASTNRDRRTRVIRSSRGQENDWTEDLAAGSRNVHCRRTRSQRL